MEETFDFENLKVYQKALEFVDCIYEITKCFPKSEQFALSDQFTRAGVSVCLNIAEGSGGSKSEFRQFLRIARRSIRECLAITEVAYRQEYINQQQRSQLRDACAELSKMTNGLMRSFRQNEV